MMGNSESACLNQVPDIATISYVRTRTEPSRACGAPVSCPAPTSVDAVALLSRTMFRALGSERWAPPQKQAEALVRFAAMYPQGSIGALFDAAYELEARHYRGEYYYKNLLVSRVVFGRHSPRTASALLELGAGRSIVDVAVFNGTSTAYEIKTDFDDFSRLPAQLADYQRCFERTYVVVSSARADAALEQAPRHVGVIAVGARGHLSERRVAVARRDLLSVSALFKMLHRGEVLDVLRRTLSFEADVPSGLLWQRTHGLFSTLPVDLAHDEVVRQLRGRGLRSRDLATTVSTSLRARAYDLPMSGAASRRITRRLQSPAAAILV